MTAIPAKCTTASPGPGRDGWVRLVDAAKITGKPLRTLRNHLVHPDFPEHAREKRSDGWWFDPRFLLGGVLATAAIPRTAPEFDPTVWSPRSIERDALIRRIVADADESAAQLKRSRLTLEKADRLFCDQRGHGYYRLGGRGFTFRRRALQGWRRAIRRGEHFAETRGRKRGTELSPIGDQAAALFLAFYKQSGQTFLRAYEMVAAQAAHHFGDPAWSWPSEATVRRWRASEHPDCYTDYYRRGSDHWRATYEPKLNRDPGELPGNHTWELDGSKCNFFGQHRGRKVRFTYALVRHVGSRVFVGHAVGLSESTEVLVRALRRAVLKYGAPKTMRTDQGKANRGAGVGDANRRLRGVDWNEVTGLAADMMAELELAQGRSGWQKGSVESGVRNVSSDFDPRFGKAYVGPDTKKRIRGVDEWADKHVGELTTLEDADRLLGEFLEAQNLRPRRDLGGLSPRQKFDRTAIEFRKVPDAVLAVRLLRAQRVRVTNRGVPIRSGGAAIHFGQGDSRVWERTGQELIARIDDDDLSRVLLCDLNNRPLFYVERDELRGVTSETLREVGKRKARARKLRREHWENVDVAATPTPDAAIAMQREYAEAQAAKREPADVPERGVTILHSGFNAELKEARRQELRAAVGAESVPLPPSLVETTKRIPLPDATDGDDGPGLRDIEFGDSVMEDGADEDVFKQLVRE